jgi:hypothetical protein
LLDIDVHSRLAKRVINISYLDGFIRQNAGERKRPTPSYESAGQEFESLRARRGFNDLLGIAAFRLAT